MVAAIELLLEALEHCIVIGSVLIRLATKRSILKKSLAAPLVQEVPRKCLIFWAECCNTVELC